MAEWRVIIEIFGVKKRIILEADTQKDAIKKVKTKLLSVTKITVENEKDYAVEFLKSIFGMEK
jgi:hypothetical protein